jgi:hypothetical protein
LRRTTLYSSLLKASRGQVARQAAALEVRRSERERAERAARERDSREVDTHHEVMKALVDKKVSLVQLAKEQLEREARAEQMRTAVEGVPEEVEGETAAPHAVGEPGQGGVAAVQ